MLVKLMWAIEVEQVIKGGGVGYAGYFSEGTKLSVLSINRGGTSVAEFLIGS